MGFIYRQWRTLGAILFAVAAVGGAYCAALGVEHPPAAQASTETAILEQIANKDTDGDGLPDWEKSLYGIPLNATTTDYFNLDMTDGEAVAKGLIVPKAPTLAAPTTTPSSSASDLSAVGIDSSPTPNSLTDIFSKDFFTLYINAEQSNGGSLTDDQINALAQQALDQLDSSVTPAPDFKTSAELVTTATSPNALISFAAAAQTALLAHSANTTEDQLSLLQDYVSTNNSQDITQLQNIAAAYQESATALSILPVPTATQVADLEIINALARLAGITSDFSNVDSDGLSTMLALDQYPQAITDLTQGFTDLAQAYATAGVVITPGSPGAVFVNLANGLATKTP